MYKRSAYSTHLIVPKKKERKTSELKRLFCLPREDYRQDNWNTETRFLEKRLNEKDILTLQRLTYIVWGL